MNSSSACSKWGVKTITLEILKQELKAGLDPVFLLQNQIRGEINSQLQSYMGNDLSVRT